MEVGLWPWNKVDLVKGDLQKKEEEKEREGGLPTSEVNTEGTSGFWGRKSASLRAPTSLSIASLIITLDQSARSPFLSSCCLEILGSHWEPLVQRAYLFQEDKCFWQLPSFKRYCLCCKPPTYHFWTQHAVIWLWHSDVQTFPCGIYPVVPLLRGGYMCFLFVPSISCLIKFHPSDLKCFLRWVLDRKLGCLA